MRSDVVLDGYLLYEEQTICSRCYRLYLKIKGLLMFQGKFLRKLGLADGGSGKDLLMRLTGRE